MRECSTCGVILGTINKLKGFTRHENKCQLASPEARAHFKRVGHWSKKGQKAKPLPPEVPEAPPVA